MAFHKRIPSILYHLNSQLEYNFIDVSQDIPLLLRKLFNAQKCIPSTSVESERAFSITGQFATKLRTKLDDDTLSSLVFLKAFYKNEAPN